MMGNYKVADKIKDGSGVEWVVARVWQHDKAVDYELINTTTGERGALRELAQSPQRNKESSNER